MKKKFNLNAAALLCTMAMTSLSAYSQDVTNFTQLKDAIEKGGDTVDITTGSNIQFDSLLEYSNKDVTITGSDGAAFTADTNYKDKGAFQATGGNLTITDVNFESFGEGSDNGVGFVIFSSGNVTLGPGVEFGSSIKTGNYRGGGLRGTIYMLNTEEDTKTLKLESNTNKDVVFSAQTGSGVPQPVDVMLTGKNINMEITGNDGNVEIGNGIASNGANLTITHSGKNNFVLGGNSSAFDGKYTQTNGTTTFKGTKYFSGTSNINAGTFNWQAENNDTGSGSIIFGENTNLTVGDGSNTSKLTLGTKDTIAQTINMVVNQNAELTLDSFKDRKALTLSNKISGQGTLKLTSDDITFSGAGSGLEDTLTLNTKDSRLKLSSMTDDTSTLTVIAKGTNDNTILDLENYSGTDNTGLNVNGKAIKELNFSGTNNYTLAEGKTLTVSADDDAEKAGVITNKSSAKTTINGNVEIRGAQEGKDLIPSLVNTANSELTINGTTGTLTNKGSVDNKGTLTANSIINDGTFTSTGTLSADTLTNGGTDTNAQINTTGGTFTVTKGVTNRANITGTSAEFGSYYGSDAKSNLDLAGTLTLTGQEAPSSNAIQNLGKISAAVIDVTGNITNNGTIKTTSGDITVSGNIINNASGIIEAVGKITANGAVTNSGTSITGSELEFGSLENTTGLIESTSGGITITKTATNAGDITSKGKLTVTESLTNTGNIKINGGELKAIENKESGSITNTGELTISGEVTGSDTSAVITNDGGKLTLSGDASNYTGTFTQTAGETTANNDYLFGGVKNIQGGTLTASGTGMYSGEVNLSGGAKFDYTLNGAEGSITSDLLKFTEDGGSAEFTSDNPNNVYTLSDNITGEDLGTVTFKNTSLKLSQEVDGNYSYKDFIFDNSTLKLGEDKGSIESFTLNKFTAKNGSKVDLNVKFEEGNILGTDSLTVGAGSTGALALGDIFISDEDSVENGKNYTTQENQGVLRGNGAGVYGLKLLKGTTSGVKGATTAFEYDITVNDDQKGISANVSKIADEHSLYKMDSQTDGDRFFQFSTKDSQEYHIDQSLDETLAGTFTVQGRSQNRAESVLSGQLKEKGGELKSEKGSFFNVNSNTVDLTVKNMTIQDADSKDRGGSVLHNENADSKVVLDNLLIQNNSSQNDKGGAVYNNGGKGTDPSQEGFTGLYVHDVKFTNNSSQGISGKGGAIYNDTNGFMMLEDVTTDAATAEALNDIYNAGTAYTNGTNKFNSLFTNEKDITFQGENTLSEFVNSGSGNAKFNGEKDIVTNLTNDAEINVNSRQAQIDSYTSTTGTVNFNSNNATLGTVTGNKGSSITNEGNLTLKGNGESYAGDFSQTTGTFTVEKDATFFGGSSSVIDGVLNWYTKNQPVAAVLNVSGGTLNVGDNAENQGEITFKNGSTITENVTTNIGKGSKLSVEDGGKVTLSNGRWYGDVSLTDGGDLTLNNLNNKTQQGGTLNAQGGKLTLDGNTQLALGTGSIIESAVETTIGKESQVFLEQGTLTLNNNDTWEGTVFMEENTNGTLTFDGYTKKLGTLQASAGSVNFTNNSKIEFGFDEKQNYSGIVKNVKTTIEKGSEVILNKGGYLELDDDAGTADQWLGKVTLSGGILDYGVKNPDSAGELEAKEGNMNLLSGSVLNIETPSSVDDKVSVDIQQGSIVDIKDGAAFNIDSKTEDKWNGLVKNEGGNFNVSGMDNTKGNGGGIQQTIGKTTLTDESNIYISDSNSFITGGDVDIDGKSKLSFGAGVKNLNAENLKMSDNTQLGILNGEINSAHADNVEVNGNANFTVDLNARNWIGDQFDFGSVTGEGATLNVSDFNFTGGAPIDRYIDFKLFTNPSDDIKFDATKDLKFTPIGYYGLQSMGEGNYRAFLDHYNPQVFRGQVATLAMYTSQLLVDDMVTNHFILHNDRLLDNAKLANKYAAASAIFNPYQRTYKDGGLWSKSYVSFDKLDLTQGLGVKNNIYGTLLGADLPSVKLKNGWEFIPTGYVGYNGGHQHFNGVSMYQNGGQLGLMGTFIKDKFIGSVTAYGGGYMNDMSVAGFEDNTGNWFAGTAAKVAYNYKPFKDFTVQPNLFVAYNAFGKQNLGTDFGIMSMNSGMLNGVNIAPGLNLILQKKTWSLYGTASYMYFINDKIDGQAGNVTLPNVRMDHGYIQYGIGGTKTWKDRFAAYGQINIRNAGINGIGFQAGVNYLFDFRGFSKGAKKAKNGIANSTKPSVNAIYDDTHKTYIKKVVKRVENK